MTDTEIVEFLIREMDLSRYGAGSISLKFNARYTDNGCLRYRCSSAAWRATLREAIEQLAQQRHRDKIY